MGWFYVKQGQRMGPVAGMGGVDAPRAVVAGQGPTCVECRRAFAAEDMVVLMGDTVCAACKPVRLQRMQEGAPVEGPCSAYADGKHLVVLRDGGLPRRCVCCNAPAAASIRRQFDWYPPWVNLLILPGVLLALIAVLILQRQMTLDVPMCTVHQRRRRWRVLGCVAWALGSLVLVPALASQGGGGGIAMGVFAVVSFLAALACGHLATMVLQPRRITADAGRFIGAGKEYLASLPAWHGGRKA